MNLKILFNQYFINLLDLIYPKSCAFCGGKIEDGSSFCKICNRLILESTSKIIKSDIFETQVALYKINDEIRSVIHDLKYHGILAPVEEILLQDDREIKNLLNSIDIITPVPLHWFRKLKRGYNQSAIIADTLSRKYSKPTGNIAKRIRHTSTQTKKTKDGRQLNIRGAFRLNKDINISGQRILLVDDVYTTGATSKEIAQVLLKGGAKSVSLISIAYV